MPDDHFINPVTGSTVKPATAAAKLMRFSLVYGSVIVNVDGGLVATDAVQFARRRP